MERVAHKPSIVLDHIGERRAAALLVDGQLDDFLVATDAPAPGTIYRAIADRPVKGQGGVFLKTPDGSAYLRGAKGVNPGQALTVQVTGYAEPGKAIPVTDRTLFKSRYAIVTPHAPGLNISRQIKGDGLRDALLEVAHDVMSDSEMGVILRSSCAQADHDDIAADMSDMRELAESVLSDHGKEPDILVTGDDPWQLAWRDWAMPADVYQDNGVFADHGVLDAVDAALASSVRLGSQSMLYIEPTRALVAVDVNTGSDGSFAAGLKANLAAAKALPRALRVRGLGGQITIDLAPMPKKDRQSFENALRAGFRADHVDTVLSGWTPLGHYELQRKRARHPLREVLR